MTLVQSARAAEFSNAYLKLDRLKANTALSGTVCAKPSSAGAGTEAKVQIIFPSDFTINSTPANWTTSTSNLPDGSSAWPGIGAAASSVNSKAVTFAGSDLTSGSTLYCFHFTGASSTTGSSGNKTGTVTTQNSSSNTIDLTDVGLSITSNDQIVVSATVAASASDYSAAITKLTTGTQFPENTEIEYQFTYGNSLSYATSISLVATWSLGTIEGAGSPTVEVLNYVVGSAGNAFGGASPVIDTVNRTITWEIPSFTGGTSDQTVNFKLKTTNNYTGSSRVSFTASSKIEFPGGETAYSDSTAYYKYSSATTSTSTSTSSGPTATPTPAPATVKPTIQLIEVREIYSDNASVFIQTNPATSKVIKFGKSPSSLNQTSSGKLSLSNLIYLTGLEPDTKYYFKVYATDASGNQTISDLYTLTTAKESEVPVVDTQNIVVVSEDAIVSTLIDKIKTGDKVIKKLVLPKNTIFQFKFSLDLETEIISAKAILKKKNVLGTSADASGLSSNIVELVETEPNVFTGKLKTGADTGEYEIYASVRDTNGNITEQKIADLRVVDKFKVYSKTTKKPVEGARVYFYIFNEKSRTYKKIPSQSISNGNPSYTNKSGEVNIVLPQSGYKAQVSALRYKEQTAEFIIDYYSEGYPIVYLEDEKFSIISFIKYHLTTLQEVFLGTTQAYFIDITGSLRFFDLVAFLSLGSLVFLTLLAFSKKNHIPVSTMLSYFYYLVDHKKRNTKYVHGVVYDEDDNPIPSANVYLADKVNEEIIANTKTNRKGEFFLRKGNKEYLIMVMAKGYHNTPLLPYEEKEHLKYKIKLEKDHQGLNIIENSERAISTFIGMSFELLLIFTFIYELLFINSFGLLRTLPFLAISIFNLLLWTLHLRHHHTN